MWPSHFYLDVCPHCYNWFVFVLRREYTNTSERPGEAWRGVLLSDYQNCSVLRALHRPLSAGARSAASHWMRSLDRTWCNASPHATAELHAFIDFTHPLLPRGLHGRSIITNLHHADRQGSNPQDFTSDSSCDPVFAGFKVTCVTCVHDI